MAASGAAKKAAQSVRDKCRSAMRLSTFAMLDATFYEDMFCLVQSTKEWRHFFGLMQKNLKAILKQKQKTVPGSVS